jgi:hypothetical protein
MSPVRPGGPGDVMSSETTWLAQWPIPAWRGRRVPETRLRAIPASAVMQGRSPL